MLNRIDVRVRDELYALILQDAQEQDCTLGEVLTRLYAASKGQRELADVEKGRPGRKPGLTKSRV